MKARMQKQHATPDLLTYGPLPPAGWARALTLRGRADLTPLAPGGSREVSTVPLSPRLLPRTALFWDPTTPTSTSGFLQSEAMRTWAGLIMIFSSWREQLRRE